MTGVVLTNGVVLTGEAPLPPGVVTATPQSQSSILVEWGDDSALPANATGFLVERSTDEENWVEVDTASTLSLTDTGLIAETTYYYRVTSMNVWGQDGPRTSPPATTPSAGPPAAPSDLVATTVSSTSISLAWTDNSDNDDGFHVQYDTVNTFDSDPQHIDTEAHVPAYAVTSLSPDTTYYFRVHAFNDSGDSDWSNTDSEMTGETVVPFFSLSATDLGIDADLVQWQADNEARIANARYWLWSLSAVDYLETGYPSLVVAHHDAAPLGAGVKIYGNLCDTPGGTLTFEDHTSSVYAANYYELGSAGGNILMPDLNADGLPDLIGTTGAAAGSNQPGAFLVGGELVVQSGVNLSGNSANYLSHIGDLDSDGDWDAYSDGGVVKNSITSLSQLTRKQKLWSGSAFVDSSPTRTIPSGIPSGVESEIITAFNSHPTSEPTFIEFYEFDVDGDGNTDIVIATYASYASQVDKIWWLKGDGVGGYTDNGATWGLPASGCFLPLMPAHLSTPRYHFVDDHLQSNIGTPGVVYLFVAGGTSPGKYVFNGTTFDKASTASCDLANILDVSDYSSGTTDDYRAQLLCLDWTNAGNIDLIYDTPRNGASWLFVNDGDGNFTQYLGPTYPNNRFKHWSPQGVCVADFDNDGLMDLALGGSDGTGVGGGTIGLSARCARIYRNTTTNPGNYLKVKIKLASGSNRLAVGATIAIYEANTATLLRQWPAQMFGLPTHFGLNGRSTVDVLITWPDGSTRLIEDVTANQTLTVTSTT